MMDVQSSGGGAALNRALDQQTLGADLVTRTLARLDAADGGVGAMTPNQDLRQAVQSAYAQIGVGTKVDTVV